MSVKFDHQMITSYHRTSSR